MTQQFGQALMWSSSFFRSSAPSDSSRKSDSSAKNCLQVSKGILHLFLEESGQFISKLQARPQQPALHGGAGKPAGSAPAFTLRGLPLPAPPSLVDGGAAAQPAPVRRGAGYPSLSNAA